MTSSKSWFLSHFLGFRGGSQAEFRPKFENIFHSNQSWQSKKHRQLQNGENCPQYHSFLENVVDFQLKFLDFRKMFSIFVWNSLIFRLKNLQNSKTQPPNISKIRGHFSKNWQTSRTSRFRGLGQLLKPRPENGSEDQLREFNFTNDDFCIFSERKKIRRTITRISDNGQCTCTQIHENIRTNSSSYLFRVHTIHYFGRSSDCVDSIRFQFVRSQVVKTIVHDSFKSYGALLSYKKLGIAFGLGHFEQKVQASIAMGSSFTARTLGRADVSHLLHKLVQPIWDREFSRDSD